MNEHGSEVETGKTGEVTNLSGCFNYPNDLELPENVPETTPVDDANVQRCEGTKTGNREPEMVMLEDVIRPTTQNVVTELSVCFTIPGSLRKLRQRQESLAYQLIQQVLALSRMDFEP